MSTVTMGNDRSVMPCVCIAQLPRLTFQMRVEKRDESIACDASTNQRVPALAQKFRCQCRRSQPAYPCLQVRHQQRRRHSFSRDVCDAQSQRVAAKPENVVIISAYDARRLPGTRNFVSRNLRNFLGQEPELDGTRFLNFALLPVKLGGDFVLRAAVLNCTTASCAALASNFNLLLQNFQKTRVYPRLLDEITNASLHGLPRQTHGSPPGHYHYRRRGFGRFQFCEDVQSFTA